MKNNNPLLSSENDCWYTPPAIIMATIQLLGNIDLDPASDAEAYQLMGRIPQQYWTAQDLPLLRPWIGRVFLNPPGGKDNGRSLSRVFWEKLYAEYLAGNVSAAIFIVFNLNSGIANNPEMADFPMVFSSRCATNPCVNGSGRIKYINGSGAESSPTHASAIVYLGDDTKAFAQLFKQFGRMMLPCNL